MNTKKREYIILSHDELRVIAIECERIGIWNAGMITMGREYKMKDCMEYINEIIANGGLMTEEE